MCLIIYIVCDTKVRKIFYIASDILKNCTKNKKPYLYNMNDKREIWVDWLRVIACFMVMVVHSTEPFYLNDGSLVLTPGDAFWASFFDSLVRCCVPLFAVASSYLLFPLRYSTGEFLRRRAVRVLIPLAIWSLVYAFWWGNPAENLKGLLVNFNYAAGHLWFVYMLLGVYLLMPLLSPWAEKVSRRELTVYLCIWLFTTTFPMLRDLLDGGHQAIVTGATGLPRQALYSLWGEASWNSYGTFYYISGFIGYLLLGLYFRRFVGDLSWKKTLAISIPAFLAGFAITFGGFFRRLMATAADIFPVQGPIDYAVQWEPTWTFDSTGVVLMTIGCILLLRKIKSDGAFYRRIVLPVSQASYGMYLAHMLVLAAYSSLFRNSLGTGGSALWVTPVEILLTAVCSYVTVVLAAVLVRRIPKVGKILMG